MAQYTINYLDGQVEAVDADDIEYDADARDYLFTAGQLVVAAARVANIRSVHRQVLSLPDEDAGRKLADKLRSAMSTGVRQLHDEQAAAIERVRSLHRPVEHGGITICAECSGWDGDTTDNSPCDYEHCSTLNAIAVVRPDVDA